MSAESGDNKTGDTMSLAERFAVAFRDGDMPGLTLCVQQALSPPEGVAVDPGIQASAAALAPELGVTITPTAKS